MERRTRRRGSHPHHRVLIERPCVVRYPWLQSGCIPVHADRRFPSASGRVLHDPSRNDPPSDSQVIDEMNLERAPHVFLLLRAPFCLLHECRSCAKAKSAEQTFGWAACFACLFSFHLRTTVRFATLVLDARSSVSCLQPTHYSSITRLACLYDPCITAVPGAAIGGCTVRRARHSR